MTTKQLKIGLICGGPSLERGISLNSARCVLDHVNCDEIMIVPFYINSAREVFKISQSLLYCNTPSDFDFKLKNSTEPLSEKAFIKTLKEIDIVFPVMHGSYGEDGGIQRLLEKNHIPFIGAGSDACKKLFDKYTANSFIAEKGFYTKPSQVLKIFHDDHEQIIRDFFETHQLKNAIIKPAAGGSSISVFSVSSPEQALEKTQEIFSKRRDTRVVIEPFVNGVEFTVIILQSHDGLPVAIFPTEIETDYSQFQIFDFRKKYLPTRSVTHHCPPRFDDATVEKIQIQAEQLFSLFKMQDFARFDGWLLPDGNIWFADFNPISGMEQNSFLFQQSTRVGLGHRDVFMYIIENACNRHEIPFPQLNSQPTHERKPIHVIFGGSTAERQVSLMSGTNVWLKLRDSQKYDPVPYLLDAENRVWKLPYTYSLNHTVEEITDSCLRAKANQKRTESLAEKVRLKLRLPDTHNNKEYFTPDYTDLSQFMEEAPFVFIGLHGGLGENGQLQDHLSTLNKGFNGPSADTCKICMDKYKTADAINRHQHPMVRALDKTLLDTKDLFTDDKAQLESRFEQAQKDLQAKQLIIKPNNDGCSSGIVKLSKAQEFSTYVQLIKAEAKDIPPDTFEGQSQPIELPTSIPEWLLLEPFIQTDIVRVKGQKLKYTRRSGYLEVTVGVLSNKKGEITVLNPSITVAEGAVLSVEEKFQGGTGVNITPPPEDILPADILNTAKANLKQAASYLGITGYSRIDAFVSVDDGSLIIIESNSLPALTPSTVLYHQALAEDTPMRPRDFLETLIANTGY